ncbi:MAG: S1C family serine protease [Gaiellaceae bacterium]
MRLLLVIAVAFASALVGGSLVYLLGEVGDEGAPEAVVVSEVAAGDTDSPASVELRPGRFEPARIYAARSPGVVTIYSFFGPGGEEHAAQGSGLVASREGYVLTSAHVVTNAGSGGDFVSARRVYVGFSDGDRVPAELVGWDLFDDVGVLRVDPSAHSLRPLPLGDSDSVDVGEPVAAIGSPFEQRGSLAVGVVSATGRSIPSLTSRYYVVDAIQTDAAITHGNSGGPLLDARGRVIGINAQIRTESGEAQGVGFAVPINAVRRSLRELVRRGRVVYPYVGLSTDDLTPSLARHLGLAVDRGALVASVAEGSPAARAGIRGGKDEGQFNGSIFPRGGDVVVEIGGRSVRSADDVARILLERHRSGEVVIFTLLRDGRRRDVSVRLAPRPPGPVEGG